MARPGNGGIRSRKIALLVANGVDGEAVTALRGALLEAGAVPRLLASTLGVVSGANTEQLAPDATLENSPSVLFDALVLPDGAAAIDALRADGHTLEFIRDQYRHCKTILAIGAAQALLRDAGLPAALPDGAPDPGLLLAEGGDAAGIAADFIAAVGRHRHLERETDPPLV
jgi:catalase